MISLPLHPKTSTEPYPHISYHSPKLILSPSLSHWSNTCFQPLIHIYTMHNDKLKKATQQILNYLITNAIQWRQVISLWQSSSYSSPSVTPNITTICRLRLEELVRSHVTHQNVRLPSIITFLLTSQPFK